MNHWTLLEIGKAVHATNDISKWQNLQIEGVAFDTRKLQPGMLFVPLKGERDGHQYIQEAINKGAVAAFWSNPLDEAPQDFPVLEVNNTLEALQTWAKDYLKNIAPKVVGITGSNGKTTTKDMTEAVLSAKYTTHKTQGNFNNEIGLPITILEMPPQTEVVVLEMGMSSPGEIKLLSDLAEPDVAAITMIGESHIEFFGSREGIADAKMEILSGLKENGVLVYPGEEPLLKERTTFLSEDQKKTFGETDEQDVYPLNIDMSLKQTTFQINKQPDLDITLPVLGTYNVQNALAALLIGEALEVPLEDGAKKLATFNLTKDRLEWLDGINGSHLLNDAYNASPSSMKAVLRDYSSLETEGRKKVLLGDIRELGKLSEEMHRSLKEVLSPQKLDEVILYGKEMRALKEEILPLFPEGSVHYFSEEEGKGAVVSYLERSLKENDTLLIKSSLGTGLLNVVEKIKANN